MELVIAAFISIITEIVKFLTKKFGKTMTKNGIILFALGLSILFAYLKVGGYLSTEFIAWIAKLLAMAVGTYELVYKRFLKPVFEAILA